MATRLNRYYNNPAIGAAFSNLASIFEPPAAQDILAYAQAEKVRGEAGALADLYGMAADPNMDQTAFDRLGTASGQWAPNQSYHAVGVTDATDRRGQDITSSDNRYNVDTTAATSRANNANTVQGALVGNLFGPLSQGQVRPEVPADIMSQFDMGGVPQIAGASKPLSATEVEGQLLLDAIDGNLVGPQDSADRYRSDINVEEYVGPDGKPLIGTRADAIGHAPYAPPGTAPSKVVKAYSVPGVNGQPGRSGTAVFDPATGFMTDEATGERLPQGTVIGDITDTQSGMTASTNSDVQKTGLAINDTMATVQRLQAMIAENPGATGIAGTIRGTVQDVIATGDDLARQFGGQIAELQRAVADNPELAAVVGPNGFDPSIPAIDMQATLLAFQLAKVLAGGDRISNQQFDQARNMVGASSVFANTNTSAAKLGEITTFLNGMAQRREPVQATPIARVTEQLGASAPAPAAPGGARTPAIGTIEEGYRYIGGPADAQTSWERAY